MRRNSFTPAFDGQRALRRGLVGSVRLAVCEGGRMSLPASGADAPVRPVIRFAAPRRQSRLSIGFRLLLDLPHLIVVYFALLVGAVVVLLGWFAALALGRLPEGFATLLEALLRYITRVYAYNWLLTDEYPPFAVNADYPVQPEF